MHELIDGAKQKIGEYVTTIYNRNSTPTAVPSSGGGTTNHEPTQSTYPCEPYPGCLVIGPTPEG